MLLLFCLAIAILALACALAFALNKRRTRKPKDRTRIRTAGTVGTEPGSARPQLGDDDDPENVGRSAAREEPSRNLIVLSTSGQGHAPSEAERPGTEHEIQPAGESGTPPDAGENRPLSKAQPPTAPTEPPHSLHQDEVALGHAEQSRGAQAKGPIAGEGDQPAPGQHTQAPEEVGPEAVKQGRSDAMSPTRPPTDRRSRREATKGSSEGLKSGANSHDARAPEDKPLGAWVSPRPRTPQPPSATTGTAQTGKGPGHRINPPWIALALHDDQKVQLVIPQQEFNEELTGEALEVITYSLMVDGIQNRIQAPAKIVGEVYQTQEQRIHLPKPVWSLHLEYPQSLKSRHYVYRHSDKRLYAFVPRADNTGKLLSSCAKLPTRLLWILLHEDVVPIVDAPVREVSEHWIWGQYRPYLFDLSSAERLVLQNGATGETAEVDCRPSFQIRGEGLLEDDYRDYSPMFSGLSVKLASPQTISGAFEVWLRNQRGRARMLADAWDAQEELPLQPLDDAPRQCGEFQVDVRESGEITPVSTLFFRCLSGLTLDWFKDLAFPDPERGHDPVSVRVRLADPQYWQVRPMGPTLSAKALADGYELTGSPGEDTCRFSISSRLAEGSEVQLSVTPPRLRWSLGKDITWLEKPACIKRGDLVGGSPLELRAQISGFIREYGLSVALFEGNCALQGPVSMGRRQGTFITELNQFYDTIRHRTHARLEVRLNVCNAVNGQSKGQLVVLQIQPEAYKLTDPRRSTTPHQDVCSTVRLKGLCKLLRRLKVLAPGQRSACKRVLQYYYDHMKGRGAKPREEVKVKFVAMTLAILKVAIGANSHLEIRGLEKWQTRVRRFEEEHPNEFRAASRLLAKRQ